MSRKPTRGIWERRIALAKKTGCFSELDQIAATRWDTCAVGEGMLFQAAARHRKNYMGGHEKRTAFLERFTRLCQLGFVFHHKVRENRPYEAEGTLSAIDTYVHRYLATKKGVSRG